MDTNLTCAVCGGPLNPADAAPSPDGMPARFLFHADLADCWRIRHARAMAWKPSKNGLSDPPYVYEEARR